MPVTPAEEMSNVNHDLYVIKEPLSLGDVQNSAVPLSSSLMMSSAEATAMMPLGAGPSHLSALYPQPFLGQTTELMPNGTLLSSPHPSQFFISPPSEAILYASTSTLHPQFVSFNDKVMQLLLISTFSC